MRMCIPTQACTPRCSDSQRVPILSNSQCLDKSRLVKGIAELFDVKCSENRSPDFAEHTCVRPAFSTETIRSQRESPAGPDKGDVFPLCATTSSDHPADARHR